MVSSSRSSQRAAPGPAATDGRTATARSSEAIAAGIQTHAYTPPPGNVVQTSRTTTAVAASAYRRLRGGRLDVVVLVLVAVIARVIVLVPHDVHAVQHRPEDVR